MNKAELIDAVASEMECTKIDASKAVDAVLASIANGVRTDERVQLAGFGTFNRKVRAARTGMNPATRETIQIAETVTCGFKPATALREAI